MLGPDTIALRSTQVRALEARACETVPAGSLMQKVARAIAVTGIGQLHETRGVVPGSRVVLFVGTGDNGGDALFAGAYLAARGARVDALLVGERVHEAGLQALRTAGGREHDVNLDLGTARKLVDAADLIIDGVVGIGGQGALRRPASELAAMTHSTDAVVIAVDLPSGVDCDTAHVADPEHTVVADVTVTSGCLKPGLILQPAAQFSGDIEVVGIGLDFDDAEDEDLLVRVDDRLASQLLARPHDLDHKFSRGVVGVASGSQMYPGAAVLSAGGARAGIAGFVRYAGRAADQVLAAWPDVVCTDSITAAGRVQCWVVGPGLGTNHVARSEVAAALEFEGPVVLDADALTLLAGDPELIELCRNRQLPTIVTPHRGEFERLAGRALDQDPIEHLTAVSKQIGATILLKGATTLIVGARGLAYMVASGPAELATAGSGDVLAGLMGALLAAHEAQQGLNDHMARELAAVAAYVHGVAGQLAVADGLTITSTDVLAQVPAAIAQIRRAGSSLAVPGTLS